MVDEDDNVRTIFWSCPIKFIPESVWSFLQCKSFYEKHPSSPFPSIDNVSPRYTKAEAIFEYEFSRSMAEGT